MTQTQFYENLRKGVMAAKVGNKLMARLHLIEATEQDPKNELAWLWLAWVAESPEKTVSSLRQAIECNPSNTLTASGLRWAEAMASFSFGEDGMPKWEDRPVEVAEAPPESAPAVEQTTPPPVADAPVEAAPAAVPPLDAPPVDAPPVPPVGAPPIDGPPVPPVGAPPVPFAGAPPVEAAPESPQPADAGLTPESFGQDMAADLSVHESKTQSPEPAPPAFGESTPAETMGETPPPPIETMPETPAESLDQPAPAYDDAWETPPPPLEEEPRIEPMETPAFEAPAETPAYQEEAPAAAVPPVDAPPAYEEPAYEEPAYEEPAYEEAEPEPTYEEPAEPEVTEDARRRILVVDDSPTVCKIVAITLEKRGHRVFTASDGVEAMSRIADSKPELILLDITMPRMDGYQLCKLIKEHDGTRHIPVVMLSGKDGFFDRVRGKLVGCTDYITKPFDPDALVQKVEHYLPAKV